MSLDTTIKDKLIAQSYERGRADALDLRSRSQGLDGTSIISEETKVPKFDQTKDYSTWPAGSPVREDDQIFKLIQPYNAANYTGTPSTLPALWSICHTKDPSKAKPYLAPNGTSGLYEVDEVCIKDSKIWKSMQANNPYPPGEVGTEYFWEEIAPSL